MHRQLKMPPGDILLVTGDIAAYGKELEYVHFNNWLGELPYQHKVVIAGNHDKALYYYGKSGSQELLSNCVYLQDSEVTVEGIRIYGAPWTPTFYQWFFMKDRGPDIRKKWDLIPSGIDILLTHGPPSGYGDFSIFAEARMGCVDLREAVENIKPAVHVFGHNHSGIGTSRNAYTLFVNCSVCTDSYMPTNEPFVLEWPFELWGAL